MDMEHVLVDCFWCGTAWDTGAYVRCPYCAATTEQGIIEYGSNGGEAEVTNQ